jgi:hypothetical protein
VATPHQLKPAGFAESGKWSGEQHPGLRIE